MKMPNHCCNRTDSNALSSQMISFIGNEFKKIMQLICPQKSM